MKKALFLDLDNTIYQVSSISDQLFKPLYNLIAEFENEMDQVELKNALYQISRRPFHYVADEYNFPKALKSRGIELLKNMSYEMPMRPYDGYDLIKTIPIHKFLVTTGFSKLQWSKVDMLGINDDFNEIHIVDLEISTKTKKDIFKDIMERFNYKIEDILVIGDDPESEIKAANELGLETFLYDPEDKHPDAQVTHKHPHLKDVLNYIN